MSPPQLAADTPVADVFQPALVRILPLPRIEHDVAVLPRLERLVGKWLHLHEPLVGKIRLNHGTAAVAVAHRVRNLVLALVQAEIRKIFDYQFTRFGTRESAVFFRAVVVERAVRIKNIDDFEIIAFSHLPVVRIVRGRDLHHAGAELLVHVFVSDHGHQTAGDGQLDQLAEQVLEGEGMDSVVFTKEEIMELLG